MNEKKLDGFTFYLSVKFNALEQGTYPRYNAASPWYFPVDFIPEKKETEARSGGMPFIYANDLSAAERITIRRNAEEPDDLVYKKFTQYRPKEYKA